MDKSLPFDPAPSRQIPYFGAESGHKEGTRFPGSGGAYGGSDGGSESAVVVKRICHEHRDGVVVVRVEEHRDLLLAIRDGGVSWQEVDAWRLDLHGDLDAAYASTRLSERPDYEAATRFLLKARRTAAQLGDSP